MRKVRYIDLFAGMGGMRIGLEDALCSCGLQGECVGTGEVKPAAKRVLVENFKEKLESILDVREMQFDLEDDLDIVLGGFPCQAFSCAGKQRGFEDTRGTLFFEVARILKEAQPKYFLLENVEGLVRHDRKNPADKTGKTLQVILSTLDELGYLVEWQVLDASKYGVAQVRKRVYLVGVRKDIQGVLPILENLKEEPLKTFREVMDMGQEVKQSKFQTKLREYMVKTDMSVNDLYGKNIRDKRGGGTNLCSWDLELRGAVTQTQRAFLVKMIKLRRDKELARDKGLPVRDGLGLTLDEIATYNHIENEELHDLLHKKYIREKEENGFIVYDLNCGKLSFEFAKVIDINKPTTTLVATEMKKLGVWDSVGLRTLTVSECLKVCGYPSNYKVPKTVTYNQFLDLIGNTVAVPLIQKICAELFAARP